MTTDMPLTSGPLYSALVLALPQFVKEPFSTSPRLNVPRLGNEIGKSHEGVRKWLRANRLTPRNAQRLIELANSEGNRTILAQLGRTAPTIEDFSRFVFA